MAELLSLGLILLLPLSLLLLLLLVLLLLYFIVRPKPVRVEIKDRHVLITGGSSGIGLALAHLCAKGGAHVTLLARDVGKLEEAKKNVLEAAGGECGVVRILAVDVRDADSVKRAIDSVPAIDVLVCNHGVYSALELEHQDLEKMKFTIDVNLIGTLNLIKAALPGMKARAAQAGPCAIALMSSQAGQIGIYGYAAYSASKFGLRGLAEVLQQELIPYNIQTSIIFPPVTDTPGYVPERASRPYLTGVISSASPEMTAEDVAWKSLRGIQAGKFMVPCSFEGFMISVATAGFAPQGYFFLAFLEVVFASFMRLNGLLYQWGWFNKIHNWHAELKKKSC